MRVAKAIVISLLTWEALLVLRRYEPRIIAITGSAGKTTTKDAIFALLSPHLSVRKTEKNLNNEFGVPLTILGARSGGHNLFEWFFIAVRGLMLALIPREYPEWLVLEVGADRPGDIRAIARWLRPDIAVLTGVHDVPPHVEFFESPQALAREKRSLVEYLKPGGKIILCGDDLRMREIYATFRGVSVRYGLDPENEYYISHDELIMEDTRPIGMRFRANHRGSSIPVTILGTIGMPRAVAALGALAVADVIGINLVSASQTLAQWQPTPGRMRLIEGMNHSIIIDDTYNSSPASALAALDTLAAIPCNGRRIAILGDMLELGKFSSEEHRAVGIRVARGIDMLITVGFRSRATGEAALDGGLHETQVREYEQGESARAGLELVRELREGDIVLVKGSQAMRMERAIRELMADPAKAPDILVRQDPEWLAR